MPKTPGRRSFLKTVALAAGASQAEAQSAAPAPPPPAAGVASPATAAHPPIAYPRVFTGRQLHMISFPLGGIAAGSLGLGGRGQLRDWEIFNRAEKGRSPGYAFPCIWARVGNAKPVARVLEARLLPPYEASGGLNPADVPGLARLESATFTGEYPLARIAFRDRELPVKVVLEAFTPIYPLDPDESGLPAAILRYRVSNPAKQAATVSIAWSLDNPVGFDPRARNNNSRPPMTTRKNEWRAADGIEGLLMTNTEAPQDAPTSGSLAIAALHPAPGKTSHLLGWPRAKWWASPLLFWDDFSDDGHLGPEAASVSTIGSVCLQREIAGGAEAEFAFVLAWHFPNRTPAWCGWTAAEGDANTVIGNHYTRRFQDAWQVAEHTAAHLPELESRMRQFLTAMRETTLPAVIKEAAMANLSTLATPTCFRTADGRFRGFEGINDNNGCCHGNCTHVWNYESATQYVFPSMARSMRDASFEIAGRLDGMIPIRIALPEGKQTGGTTAADGTWGQIIKAYLDWQMSGDTAWLKGIWPNVRKAIAFAWVDGGWDGDKDGVAEGVQHNTYDVEFYGPNPMCGIYYLGALRAGEEMARAAGDSAFADECARLRQNGSKWIDDNLFNGEYYVQKVRGIPTEKIAKPLRSTGGAEDPEHPDFQLGEGCLVDQLVGQYVADYAGLGSLVSEQHIRKTLESIYKYNYKRNLYDHDSVQRVFALNDEAALIICDYGAGKRPRIPFPYFAELFTGAEYTAASLMLFHGMTAQGLECVENIRRRYDGERRNPWDESECGRHYARAMASWSAIVALSGFRYVGAESRVVAAPRWAAGSLTSFWSTATGWGTFTQKPGEFSLAVRHGKLPCRSVELAMTASSAKPSARIGTKTVAHQVRRQDGRLVFEFAEPVLLAEGDRLVLTA